MTRNTKIALGCGGAGCLGLIVVVIAVGILIFVGVIKAPGIYSPDSNYNSNYNANYNYNSNSNSSNTNDNLNTNSDSSPSSSSMSEDDKHRLLLAASLANDPEMMQRVMRKLGFFTASGVSSDYAQFVKEHAEWAMRNREFINSVNTPEKARAYLEEHIDD